MFTIKDRLTGTGESHVHTNLINESWRMKSSDFYPTVTPLNIIVVSNSATVFV